MNFAKRFLAVAGAIAVAAILGAVVAPKAAHAVAAALVQVTNTTTNPVPSVDVNTPAEEPFQTILCFEFGQYGPCSEPQSFIAPSTTTDGANVKRLVIQDLSGSCQTTSNSGNTFVEGITLQTSLNENSVNSVTSISTEVPLAPPAVPTVSRDQIFSQPVRIYVDPGSFVELQISAVGSDVVDSSAFCAVTVYGYLVTK